MSLKWLTPDWEPGVITSRIPLQHLLDQDLKALVIDVDGTLVSGSRPLISEKTKVWLSEAGKHLALHLLSNNPSKKRIRTVAEELALPYTYKAAKPRKGALQKVLIQLNEEPEKVGMIGDRLFTDVLAGNRLGLYTILVKPLNENKKGSRPFPLSIQQLEKGLINVLMGKLS